MTDDIDQERLDDEFNEALDWFNLMNHEPAEKENQWTQQN
jgi:hypothetical protein